MTWALTMGKKGLFVGGITPLRFGVGGGRPNQKIGGLFNRTDVTELPASPREALCMGGVFGSSASMIVEIQFVLRDKALLWDNHGKLIEGTSMAGV